MTTFLKEDDSMFQIVPATPQTDFSAVSKLYFETWQTSYHGLIPQRYLDSLTPATWHPEKRQAGTLLAMSGERIVGVCSFGAARLSEYRPLGELYSLYVHPSVQHHGIGRALLVAALQRLDAKFNDYYLVVLERNFNAIALYESQGFKRTEDQRTEVTPFGTLHEVVFGRGNYFRGAEHNG